MASGHPAPGHGPVAGEPVRDIPTFPRRIGEYWSMSRCRLALVQLDAGTDKDANVERALRLVPAPRNGRPVRRPSRTFHCAAHPADVKRANAEPIPGPLSGALSELATEHGVYLLGGSFNELQTTPMTGLQHQPAVRPGWVAAASYRKIHLFDAVIEGKLEARESGRNRPGDRPVVADTAFGRVGLTICYDLRFPELYRALAVAGARLLFVPSNFTERTGSDHWEVLLRARAIENGMFIVAPAQLGGVEGAFPAYGRSMVVDPWGTVLACAPDEVGTTIVDIDLEAVTRTREHLPSLTHRRPDTYR